MATLTCLDNTFDKANHARCFNHTLQLSVKALLGPFNIGMSTTKPASEEEEAHNFDEIPALLDEGAIGDDETGDYDDGNSDGYGEDLDGGNDKADDADSETDVLNQLDEKEREEILLGTAVV